MSVRPITDPESTPEAWQIPADLRRQLLDALGAPAISKMTYEAFLAWADEDTLAEWVDGEVVMASPASNQHQDIIGFLEAVLRLFVEERALGIVRSAPFQMKLPGSGREPDLLFVATQHLDRMGKTYLDGPADLAVEVISPESVGRDRGDKFYEYARGGVPEYWLIDPNAQWAEFYRLIEGRYRLAFEGQSGRFHAQEIPGFWVQVEWFWNPPHVLDVLRQLQVIP